MQKEKEVWKGVKGYKGIYEVSSFGRVKSLSRLVNCKDGKIKSLKQRILKPYDHRGYLFVILQLNGKIKRKGVHQLVAESFLNHTVSGHKLVVNHVDFNSLNNEVSNLEVITQRLNANQKHMKSSSQYVGVNWSKYSSRWISRIWINGKSKYLGGFKDEIQAHNAYQKELKQLMEL